MRHLAESLLDKFGQHIICVSDKDEIMMLENTETVAVCGSGLVAVSRAPRARIF